MPRWKSCSADGGSATLEFLTAGLVLLVPLVYLVLVMSAIQAGAMAAEAGARQAARVFVLSSNLVDARTRATTAVELAVADHGIDPDHVAISVACSPQASQCFTRSGLVTIMVDVLVPLPLVPPVLVGELPVQVPLRATATQQVSRFWGAG